MLRRYAISSVVLLAVTIIGLSVLGFVISPEYQLLMNGGWTGSNFWSGGSYLWSGGSYLWSGGSYLWSGGSYLWSGGSYLWSGAVFGY